MNTLIKLLKSVLLAAIVFACNKSRDQLLISSSRNGNGDIYLMNDDGSELRQITSSKLDEWAPTWITKNEISFLRQDGDKITRYKIDIHSKEESEMPHPNNCILDDKNALYDKEGKYAIYPCDGDIYIWDILNDKIDNLTVLLAGTSNYPIWSGNFKKIIFTNNQSGSNDIYELEVESKKVVRLTEYPSNDERGSLSHDGTKLLFSSNMEQKGNQDIFILDLKTKELTNITNSDGQELIARWSKDDKSVFFGSNKDGNWEIYSFGLENNKTRRLTNNPEFDGDPRIAPY